MITRLKDGNIFSGSHEALINPVNLQGRHGALAGQFALRFPEQCKAYTELCEQTQQVFGEIVCMRTDLNRPKYILHFPTTPEPGLLSNMAFIVAGLPSVQALIVEHRIKSIGIPALGCGVGGLDFEEVFHNITEFLDGLDCDIVVYEPLSQ